jgi:hypothetical protein
MGKRQMKWLWRRLRELTAMAREEMLMKLEAARSRRPRGAWSRST